MKPRTSLKFFAVLAIGAICLALAWLLIAPHNPSIPGLTILDPRLRVVDCHVSYGTEHCTDLHPAMAELHRKFSYLQARVLNRPIPVLFDRLDGHSRTNALTIACNGFWDSPQSNICFEMTDAAGHRYPTELLIGAGSVWGTSSWSNMTLISVIRAVDCPASLPPGDYEFQVLLGSNGPPLAKYKTSLKLK